MRNRALLAISLITTTLLGGCVTMTPARKTLDLTSHFGEQWRDNVHRVVHGLNRQIGCEAVRVIPEYGIPMSWAPRKDMTVEGSTFCGVAYVNGNNPRIFLSESIQGDYLKVHFVLQHEIGHHLNLGHGGSDEPFWLMNRYNCSYVGVSEKWVPVLRPSQAKQLNKEYCIGE